MWERQQMSRTYVNELVDGDMVEEVFLLADKQLRANRNADMYLLATELLKYPLYLGWSSTRLDTFRNGTFQLLNTNHRLILNYRGMDGMKTGYHRRAGFNLVSTAKRKGQRYLVGVLGAINPRLRSKATRNLLDYGFKNYSKYVLNKKGDTVPFSVSVENGEAKGISLKTSRIPWRFS